MKENLPEIAKSRYTDRDSKLKNFPKLALQSLADRSSSYPIDKSDGEQSKCGDASEEKTQFLDCVRYTNRKIRKAFAYAIDRKSVVKHLFDGKAKAAFGILAPCFALNQEAHFQDTNYK